MKRPNRLTSSSSCHAAAGLALAPSMLIVFALGIWQLGVAFHDYVTITDAEREVGERTGRGRTSQETLTLMAELERREDLLTTLREQLARREERVAETERGLAERTALAEVAEGELRRRETYVGGLQYTAA